MRTAGAPHPLRALRSTFWTEATSGSNVGALLPAQIAISGKYRAVAFEAEQRLESGSGKGVREHLHRVAEDECRAVFEGGRHVPDLHPPLGAPAQELDL